MAPKSEIPFGRRTTLTEQALYAIESLLFDIECDALAMRDTERLEEAAYMESCDALEIAQRRASSIETHCKAAKAWIEKARVLMFGNKRETEKAPFGEN